MTIDELITHLEELKKTHYLENVEIQTPVREQKRMLADPYPKYEHTGEMNITLTLYDLRRNSQTE